MVKDSLNEHTVKVQGHRFRHPGRAHSWTRDQLRKKTSHLQFTCWQLAISPPPSTPGPLEQIVERALLILFVSVVDFILQCILELFVLQVGVARKFVDIALTLHGLGASLTFFL